MRWLRGPQSGPLNFLCANSSWKSFAPIFTATVLDGAFSVGVEQANLHTRVRRDREHRQCHAHPFPVVPGGGGDRVGKVASTSVTHGPWLLLPPVRLYHRAAGGRSGLASRQGNGQRQRCWSQGWMRWRPREQSRSFGVGSDTRGVMVGLLRLICELYVPLPSFKERLNMPMVAS